MHLLINPWFTDTFGTKKLPFEKYIPSHKKGEMNET
jgi:hypothetical protein